MKKVLVWGLSNNRAGTEAVIVNYASRAEGISFDYLCYDEPLNHWSKLNRNGSRYFVIPTKIKDPVGNAKSLRAFMKAHAREYDVFWFNVNEASNIDPLILAKRYGIPRRIVHMHNSQLVDSKLTRIFHKLNHRKMIDLATDLWACSSNAASFLCEDDNVRILPNFIDAESVVFDGAKREAVRSKLGLNNAFVIGAVGRLTYQKNPLFLVQLLPALIEAGSNAHLMFVGAGELEQSIRDEALLLSVEERVHLVGTQDDVQAYLSAFDVYAQPSHFEGLSISVLEAQFNGLPCVVSQGMSDECIISSNISRLSIDDSEVWVEAILRARRDQGGLLEESKKYDARFVVNKIRELF